MLLLYLKNMNKIEGKLNYTFDNKSLLSKALTHSSISSSDNYETLEFLGDSIINYFTTTYLLNKYPKDNQADLSIKRSQIVNKKKMSYLSKSIGLYKYLKINTKIDISERLHCDIFEALIGALYIDSDINTTSKILNNLFNKYIKLTHLKKHYDYKGLIISIKKKNKINCLNLKTHFNNKLNLFISQLNYNEMFFYGFSHNKKNAEKRCSEITFKNINIEL